MAAPMDFYKDSLARFTGWMTYEDAKAAFALTLLAIAFSNLLSRASSLVHAHALTSGWGDVATVAFYVALVAAVSVLTFAWLTVFPRTKPHKGEPVSLYYHKTVAGYRSAAEFQLAVENLPAQDFEKQLAAQVWELALHASRKARFARFAFVAVLAFLVSWGVTRVALALALGS
jgi:hypothetical protein